MTLSGTQFFGTPPKDLQGTIDNHCPFEINTYIHTMITLIKLLKSRESCRNFDRVSFKKWTKTPCRKSQFINIIKHMSLSRQPISNIIKYTHQNNRSTKSQNE